MKRFYSSYAFPKMCYRDHPNEYILNIINSDDVLQSDLKSYSGVIGFDMEWPPVVQSKTTMLQLADDSRISLIHLSRFQGFPEPLKTLLEDKDTIKVGVGIAADATKLYKDFDVQMESFVELQDVYKLLPDCSGKKLSLQSFTLAFLDRHLFKDVGFQFHYGWAKPMLSFEHREYAANDVYATYWAFQALLARLDPHLEIPKRSYQDVIEKKAKKSSNLALNDDELIEKLDKNSLNEDVL